MRVGRIGYVNCYPVFGAVDRGLVRVDAEIVTGAPTELNELLAAGELDLSVVSAVEYARNASAYHLLPGLGVSCDGPVRSVVLFTRRPVAELGGETVLVSASSRTSVNLLELLCEEVWHVQPKLVAARAEAQDLDGLAHLPHSGVLVIGDPALILGARETYPYSYDLGAVWKSWTGLPFVFAVWAARRDAEARGVRAAHAALLRSRAWGLAHLEVLADAASQSQGIPHAECLAYLSGLDYDLSYRHLEGLTSFLRRLAQRGVVRDGALAFLAVA